MLWRKKIIFGLEFRIRMSSAITVCCFMPSHLGRWKPTRSCVDEENTYWPCRIRQLWFSEVRCLPWHYDLTRSSHLVIQMGVIFWKLCLQQSLIGRFKDNCWQQIPQCLVKIDFYWVDLCVQLIWTGGRWEHVFCPEADFRVGKRTHTNLMLSWKHPSVTDNLYMQLFTTKKKGWQDCGTMCISNQGTRQMLKGFSKN